MRAILATGALFLALTTAAAEKPRAVTFDPSLPVVGTKFATLPDGKGMSIAQGSCLPCHSADMLAQQRLTPKQWTAEVDKMVKWGAAVKDADKPVLVDYLAKHFGPENRFVPRKVRGK